MQLLPLVLSVLKYVVITAVALYFLIAIGLTMIAARLRSGGGWMAWIPVVNFFLLCRLAQSSFWLVLPLVIPVAGLIALGYLGARIARRLGQPGFVGALFGVPVIGALVPIPLALAGRAPALESGQAGQPSSLGLKTIAIALGVIAIASAGFIALGRMTRSKPVTAEQAVAALPQHTAGSLAVFPLDTDKVHPAKPSHVITQYFGSLDKAKSASVSVTKEQLPPWIAPASLPLSAGSLAAADYRVQPQDQPVTVVVLGMRTGESVAETVPTKQEIASLGMGAEATGIEVKTSSGETYRGYRVKSDDAAYYALQNTDSRTGVVISANKGADLAMAERLALGVGNGKGLLEYEEYAGSFGQLPPPPAGMDLGDVQTFTEADINQAVQELDKQIRSNEQMQNAAIGDLFAQARLILPSRVSVAEYNAARPEENVAAAVAGYSNARSAWVAMQTIGFFVKNSTSIIRTAMKAAGAEGDVNSVLAMVPAVESITIGDASGYKTTVEGMSGILIRQGGSIAVLFGPPNGPQLDAWAASYVAASAGK